mmetsp:Transcript_70530/g.131932  ORF Transcript_70530/g.131932 Transcript_70530/m.131932 type:complete len:261 (-) Transcript_70530:51-833(-)
MLPERPSMRSSSTAALAIVSWLICLSAAYKAEPIVRSQHKAAIQQHDHLEQEQMAVDAHGNVASFAEDDPDDYDGDTDGTVLAAGGDAAAVEAAEDAQAAAANELGPDGLPNDDTDTSDEVEPAEVAEDDEAMDESADLAETAPDEGEPGAFLEEPLIHPEHQAEQAEYQAMTERYQTAIGQPGRNMEEVLPEDDIQMHGKVDAAHELAQALMGLGRHYEAVGWYRAAHAFAPRDAEIKNGFDHVLSLTQDEEEEEDLEH